MTRTLYTLALTLSLLAGLSAAPPTRKPPAPIERLADYSERQMSGFKVMVNGEVFKHEKDFETSGMEVLRGQFRDTVERLPADALKELRRSTTIWVEWDRVEPENAEAVAVYRSGSEEAVAAKGVLGAKANGVEIISLKRIAKTKQPGIENPTCVLLHELAHAWHQQILGGENAAIKAAYRQAVDRKLYESVKTLAGKQAKAYAAVNESEYFAEISEAFLGENDYYPFNKTELKEHDPVGYRLMLEAWTSLESARKLAKQEDSSVARTDTPKPKVPAAVPSDEVAAQKKLDVVKLLIAAKKNADALEVIDEILKRYPETAGGREAASLRTELKNRK